MRGLDADWIAQLRSRADQPPLRPRVPLWWGASAIGSLEPRIGHAIVTALGPQTPVLLEETVRGGTPGWQVNGELTASLALIAIALRGAGLAGAWRDEALAVTNKAGVRLGTVERGAVRPLGIPSFAVHLAALTQSGMHWVQRRSLSKANDPGLWDTLMGGMVPAADSLEEALARETWEEAGLRIAQLQGLRHGGRIATRRPSADGDGAGYVVEAIDWYVCTLPDGLVPCNQDGEVEEFALLEREKVVQRLQAWEFTCEAALVLWAAAA